MKGSRHPCSYCSRALLESFQSLGHHHDVGKSLSPLKPFYGRSQNTSLGARYVIPQIKAAQRWACNNGALFVRPLLSARSFVRLYRLRGAWKRLSYYGVTKNNSFSLPGPPLHFFVVFTFMESRGFFLVKAKKRHFPRMFGSNLW